MDLDDFEEVLKKYGFTKYESRLLGTLMQYDHLDASTLANESGVPQPKVYENLDNLDKKYGLIEIIPLSKKKNYYKIHSKQKLLAYFDEKLEETTNDLKHISHIIQNNFMTSEVRELPFVGIGGEQIEPNLLDFIEQTKNHLIVFIPKHMYTPSLLKTFNTTGKKIKIHVIFPNKVDLDSFKDQLPNCALYFLPIPAFEIINEMFGTMLEHIPSHLQNSYVVELFHKLFADLPKLFGLILSDTSKSFFLVPIPIDYDLALISTQKQIVEFHTRGAESILNAAIPYKKK